jgi:hypothetical protein
MVQDGRNALITDKAMACAQWTKKLRKMGTIE